ncbi:unnamed protein product [Lathyrus oleraceus]
MTLGTARPNARQVHVQTTTRTRQVNDRPPEERLPGPLNTCRATTGPSSYDLHPLIVNPRRGHLSCVGQSHNGISLTTSPNSPILSP